MATLATNKNSSLNPVDRKNNINKSTTKSNAIIILIGKDYSNTSYHDCQRANDIKNNVLVDPMCQWW